MSHQVKTKVIIPFRLRENADLRRSANLKTVLTWWWMHGFTPAVQSDGLDGDAQFNRHRAYNSAVEEYPDADVYVFSEADMLIPIKQVMDAIAVAYSRNGLVVPFTQYRYLADKTTEHIRNYFADGESEEVANWVDLPTDSLSSLWQIQPESTMDNGRSIGAVNVVSRETLLMTGGFTEATSGNWYDDRIVEEGFTFLTGAPTAYIDGPAVHLYHLPGWKGDHLTDEDRAATQRNKDLLNLMRRDIRAGDRQEVKNLMEFRQVLPERTES